MKKLTYLFAASVLIAGTACNRTDNKSTERDTMGTTTGSTTGDTTGTTTGGTTTGGTTGSTTGMTTGSTTGSTSGTTSGSTSGTTSGSTSGTTSGTTHGTTTGTTSGTTSGSTTSTTSGTTSGTTTGTTSGTTTGTTAGTTSGTTGSTTTGTTGTTTGGMSTSSNMTNMDDNTFMMTAASSNMMEIEAGKMAEEKATSPKVKEFGKMMVEQHTKTSQEMKPLASKMGVTMPTTLMPMHQEMLDELSGKSGAEFDEAYMDLMEKAHKMDVDMFEAKSKNAKSQSVRAFADKTLPTLRSHHKQASQTESRVD